MAIAKILAQEPQVILADEPVASLDVTNGGAVMATLQRIAFTASLTVVANLHHVEYARHHASRVLGLRDDRLVFDGSPTRLTEAALRDIFGDTLPPGADQGLGSMEEEVWVLS